MKIIGGNETKHPIKLWTDYVPNVEEAAMQQLKNIANMPFIYKHVAVMPDVHLGIGATIGSVVATKGAIIPAAVGVDIGCGMMAVQTNLTSKDLPDNLLAIRTELERLIPHGRTMNGGSGDRGAWHNVPDKQVSAWDLEFKAQYELMCAKHPGMKANNTANHLGTLGSGNHFVEICLDETDQVWIMLHSGSRGLGNRIGTYFIDKAKEEMSKYFIHLPDKDLAYLVEGSELFGDYYDAVKLAQEFALINRGLMRQASMAALRKFIPHTVSVKEAVNCHHNYVDTEHHFGHNVIVTRKGAVRARTTDLGIIPGSMGAKSFIVRGLGNEQSFCSCSHGAGRVMSRNQAKKEVSLEQHIADTKHVECRKDADVVDETPKAYKNIDDVMKSQEDLVEIVHTLRQLICVKG